jgi:hypothetical protein
MARPRCPALNCVDNLSKIMRGKWLSNRMVTFGHLRIKSLDDIVDHGGHIISIGLRQ